MLKQAGRIDLVDVGRGKYFRILASVVADGKDLAAILIEKGVGCSICPGAEKPKVGVNNA